MARTKQEARKGFKQPLIRPEVAHPPAPAIELAPGPKSPSLLRFPLVATLSLAISLGLRALSSPFSAGDLSSVSSQRDDWIQISGFMAWRLVGLAAAWFGGHDGGDLEPINQTYAC